MWKMDEVWKFFWRKKKSQLVCSALAVCESYFAFTIFQDSSAPIQAGVFQKKQAGSISLPLSCSWSRGQKDEGGRTRASWQLQSRPPKMSLGGDVTALPSLLVTSWEQLIWPLDWPFYSQPALQLRRNMMIFRIRYFKVVISQTIPRQT